MKRILSMILAVITIFSLASCGSGDNSEKEDPAKELYGKWSYVDYLDAKDVEDILKYYGFQDKEYALVDTTKLGIVKTVEFKEDGTYLFEYDEAETKAQFSEFYDKLILTIFENVKDLTDIYGKAIITDCKDIESFRSYYAKDLFNKKDYKEFLEYLAGDSLDYESLKKDTEKGKFEIKNDKIIFTAEGTEVAESVDYKIEGAKLSLVYSNATEVYEKVSADEETEGETTADGTNTTDAKETTAPQTETSAKADDTTTAKK